MASRSLPLFVLSALCLTRPVLAQHPGGEDPLPEPADAPAQRKGPSLFRRVARDSASEQLAHAAALEKEGRTDEAAKQYRALVHRWHDTPEAPQAQLGYARLLLARGAYDKAFNEYQYLIEFFTGQFHYEEALQQQFSIASHFMTAPGRQILFFGGSPSPARALPLFKKIVANGPTWERAPEAQFYIGLIHEELKEFTPAVSAYEAVLYRYSDSEFAEESSFRRAHCLYILGRKGLRDEAACRRALSALAGFLRDYEDNVKADTVRAHLDEMNGHLAGMYFDRALFYDRSVDSPRAALIAYNDYLRQFPLDEKADRARARRNELKRKLESTDEQNQTHN